jgi:hypothetical protein
MRIAAPAIAAALLLALQGCFDIKIGDRAGQPRSDEKGDHQGWSLTVAIDGSESSPGEAGPGGVQYWTVPSFSARPVIRFAADKKKLGKFRMASVWLNPYVNGDLDCRKLYKLEAADLAPGRECHARRWGRFFDGYEVVEGIPSGRYRLAIQAWGEKSWDRQYMNVEVR